MFREPEEPEENPFRNYRHTASVVGLPAFVSVLLLMLASVQPAMPGRIGIWVWCAAGLAVLFALLYIVGRTVVRNQTRKGNPHCATPVGRNYMLLVFVCAIAGVVGVAGLVFCVLTGRIRLHIGLLLPAMMAALTVALIVAGFIWRLLGKPRAK
ncbi:hypothetical protein [Rikenella microfusus]|uniref:hypothetical protein n=1 Tax=Rikenella microfusus TaxID=28139 RepID=UPI003A9258CE